MDNLKVAGAFDMLQVSTCYLGFQRKKADVLSHWSVVFDGVQHSTTDFYADVEKELVARRVPGLIMTRVDFAEGGSLSDRRLYLRMLQERLVFDFCAAPFGRAYFFSLRFAEIPIQVAWWQLAGVGSSSRSEWAPLRLLGWPHRDLPIGPIKITTGGTRPDTYFCRSIYSGRSVYSKWGTVDPRPLSAKEALRCTCGRVGGRRQIRRHRCCSHRRLAFALASTTGANMFQPTGPTRLRYQSHRNAIPEGASFLPSHPPCRAPRPLHQPDTLQCSTDAGCAGILLAGRPCRGSLLYAGVKVVPAASTFPSFRFPLVG